MNIFYLDEDLKKCAEYHCDKHVVKMITEYNQLLSSVHWVNNSEAPYKLTHKNHPCSKWVQKSLSNYKYLVELNQYLCKEYTNRYCKIHKGEHILSILKSNLPNIKDEGFSDPPKCMPEEYKVEDTIESYRNYYRYDKIRFAKWKNKQPQWMKENLYENAN